MRNTTMMEKLAAVFPVRKEEPEEILLDSITLPVPVEEEVPPAPEPSAKPTISVTKAKSTVTKAKKKKVTPAKKSSSKAKKVTTQVETTDTVTIRIVDTTNVDTNESLGPRYIPNPKLKNPFSVHVYPVLAPGQNDDPYAEEPETPVLPLETKQSGTEAVSGKVEDAQTQEPVVLQNAPLVVETSQPESTLQIVEELKEESTMNATQAVIVSPESAEKISLVPQLKSDLPVEIKDSPKPEEKPAVVVSSSSNLEWLNKPTPFKDHLKGMVENLSDAKNNIAFTLEQLRARQKKLESELFEVQFLIEQQKDNLRQLDDTISACALVAEQSASIPPGLLTSVTAHKTHAKTEDYTNGKIKHRGLDDPTACHQGDIVKFFAMHPNSDWTSSTILEELPEIKREHAKKYLNVLLPTMYKGGKIQRVGIGIYRALES
jgi:hypothetical protein